MIRNFNKYKTFGRYKILDDNYKVLARVSSIVNHERMYSLNMNAFKIRYIFYI